MHGHELDPPWLLLGVVPCLPIRPSTSRNPPSLSKGNPSPNRTRTASLSVHPSTPPPFLNPKVKCTQPSTLSPHPSEVNLEVKPCRGRPGSCSTIGFHFDAMATAMRALFAAAMAVSAWCAPSQTRMEAMRPAEVGSEARRREKRNRTGHVAGETRDDVARPQLHAMAKTRRTWNVLLTCERAVPRGPSHAVP